MAHLTILRSFAFCDGRKPTLDADILSRVSCDAFLPNIGFAAPDIRMDFFNLVSADATLPLTPSPIFFLISSVIFLCAMDIFSLVSSECFLLSLYLFPMFLATKLILDSAPLLFDIADSFFSVSIECFHPLLLSAIGLWLYPLLNESNSSIHFCSEAIRVSMLHNSIIENSNFVSP